LGAFFTNVQARVGDRSPDEARAAVLQAVRGWLAEQGLELIDGRAAAEEADRVVLVAPAGQGRWIGVYDEGTEDQDERVLRGLTERLSAATGAAVGVLDHDSDVLRLWLCRDGALVDAFNNRPDYFVGAIPGARTPTAQERARLAGLPERWRELLVPGATPEQLRAAWDARAASAEDVLARLVGSFAEPVWVYRSKAPTSGAVPV
jgi:hypothetical protein